MNSPALLWNYLLCQATKPMVLPFPLCSSPEHTLSSRCACFSPVLCWLQLVDSGWGHRGTAGGRGALRVAASRVVQLNHPATFGASQSHAAVKKKNCHPWKSSVYKYCRALKINVNTNTHGSQRYARRKSCSLHVLPAAQPSLTSLCALPVIYMYRLYIPIHSSLRPLSCSSTR